MIIKNTLNYLFERFQIHYLLPLIILSNLGLSAISQYSDNHVFLYKIFALNIFQYWIIRVVDEIFDFEHDRIFYPNRPTVRGEISIQWLVYSLFLGAFIFCVVFYNQINTLLPVLLILSMYCVINKKYEKFLLERIGFIATNLVSLISSVIIISSTIYMWSLNGDVFNAPNIIKYTALTISGTLLLEFSRKISRKNSDNYISHLGINAFWNIILILSLVICLMIKTHWAIVLGALSIIQRFAFPRLFHKHKYSIIQGSVYLIYATALWLFSLFV